MPDAAPLADIAAQVLWAAFALAVVFGAVAQRTHFCTMGAVADIVTMGDWTRMRMWVMAVGVAAIGFYGMGWLGWIDTSQSLYTGSRFIWLRATGSTMFSQLIDSFVVIGIAFYVFGNWDLKLVFSVGTINYLYKGVVAILLTPLLYIAHYFIDNYLGKEYAEELSHQAAHE